MMPLVMSCSLSEVTRSNGFVVEDQRVVGLDACLLGDVGLLVGVDVLGGNLVRRVGVFLQLVLERGKVLFLRKHLHLQRSIKLGQHVAALVGERELLVRGQVPALVLLLADVIDRDQDAEHYQNADAGHRAVARLASGKRRGDFPPLTDSVKQHRHQAAPRQVIGVLFFRRHAEADRDRDQHHPHADPTDDVEYFLNHPRHRSLSTDFEVRNNPKVMKLR
jgi:hypothetical protein